MRRLVLFSLSLLVLLLVACQPTGLRLDPNKGSVDGGDTISIFGGPFGAGMRVEFGGKPVGTVTVASPEQLQVTVPSGNAVGPVDVVLIDSHGTRFELPKAYEYLPRKEGASGTGGAK
jgi:hypothetical protein